MNIYFIINLFLLIEKIYFTETNDLIFYFTIIYLSSYILSIKNNFILFVSQLLFIITSLIHIYVTITNYFFHYSILFPLLYGINRGFNIIGFNDVIYNILNKCIDDFVSMNVFFYNNQYSKAIGRYIDMQLRTFLIRLFLKSKNLSKKKNVFNQQIEKACNELNMKINIDNELLDSLITPPKNDEKKLNSEVDNLNDF